MTFTFHRSNWVTDFNFKQQVRLPAGDNSCTWIQVIKKRLTRQDVLRFQLPRNKVSIHDSMHNTTTLWHEQYLSKTSYKSDITMNSVQASKLLLFVLFIWGNCQLADKLDQGQGDRAYRCPMLPWMLITFTNPVTRQQRRYNSGVSIAKHASKLSRCLHAIVI